MHRGLALWFLLQLGCEATSPELARRGVIVSSLLAADEVQLRARPALMAGKYQHMAQSPFDFYRGSFFLFLRDARDGSSAVGQNAFAIDVQPLALGDAHLENFGLLHGAAGELTLEPNDLDAADRWPFEVDLRRLNVSLLLGARLAQADRSREDEQAIVTAALHGYLARIQACAAGRAPEDEAPEDESPHVTDLVRRGTRDGEARAELTDLTELHGDVRRFRRGVLDPEDPQSVTGDLPAWAVEALPLALTSYRGTLYDPPPAAFFTPLDAVREYGGGVASWSRVRVMVLVRGPSDAPEDDVVLEVKEALDSGARETVQPGRFFDDLTDRVLTVRDAAWSRRGADPLWGMGFWAGLRVQIRSESEWNKNLRVSRFEEERASTTALVDLATRLGRRVGNMHSAHTDTATPCVAIAERVKDGENFVRAETEVALAYVTRVQADYTLFREALAAHGPLLGYPRDNLAPPSRELQDLFGTPPAQEQP